MKQKGDGWSDRSTFKGLPGCILLILFILYMRAGLHLCDAARSDPRKYKVFPPSTLYIFLVPISSTGERFSRTYYDRKNTEYRTQSFFPIYCFTVSLLGRLFGFCSGKSSRYWIVSVLHIVSLLCFRLSTQKKHFLTTIPY